MNSLVSRLGMSTGSRYLEEEGYLNCSTGSVFALNLKEKVATETQYSYKIVLPLKRANTILGLGSKVLTHLVP